MTTIACIGECMIELSENAEVRTVRGFGGDTLNTAVYLARLGAHVDYITALGDDPFSDEMLEAWQAEGIGTTRVLRIAGKLPGLYAIRTNEAGERRFYYWRENSAARMVLDQPETETLLGALSAYNVVYLSGITLSLYNERGRARLLDALARARQGGVRVAFDTNFRPRGWPSTDVARHAFELAFSVSDIVLASVEDLAPLYATPDVARLMAHLGASEVVMKLAEPGCIVRCSDGEQAVPTAPALRVIDTTAAGDSFSAAYLAARLAGVAPFAAARAGHRLAGEVVKHPGAIIPETAMPKNVLGEDLR